MSRNEVEIYNNYVTPLAGTFINLPEQPCFVQCPGCGIKEMSNVIQEEHRTSFYNLIVSRLIYCCCCCCIDDIKQPLYTLQANHYCKNCSCYFGQHQRIHKMIIEKKR